MSLVLDRIGLKNGADIVIDNVSLSLERGKMNVLLGPTLSGKTTLMRLMAGLDQPSSGRLLLDGQEITGLPVRKRSVAMVYQQFVNYPSLTVYENIASPLRVAKLPRAEIEARVQQAAKLLRLENLLTRMPGQLSGGQQQRTAIARALVKRADVVLLDEPLANLDYKLREELREQLPPLFAETNAILVYATTEPSEGLLLGGQTATLWQGRVTQHGPTGDVYRRPQNIDAAAVFSDPPLNQLAVEKQGAWVMTRNGRQFPATGVLTNLSDGAYTVAFRCDDVSVGGGTSSFSGTVAVTELSGSENFVHVDVGLGTWVCLLSGHHIEDFAQGMRIDVSIDMQRAFAFAQDGSLAAAPAMAATA